MRVARAIQAGASGFVTKDAEPEFIMSAIRTVAKGNAVIAPAATFDLLRTFSDRHTARIEVIESLSSREKEIFLLVAKGLSNAESPRPLSWRRQQSRPHVASIFSKLGLRSRVQVVALAWESGLVA